MEFIAAGKGVVDLQGVLDVDDPAGLAQRAGQLLSTHPHRHIAIGRLVDGQMPPPLLEHHLQAHRAHAHHAHLIRIHLEAGDGALQTGQGGLPIGQVIAAAHLGQHAWGDQLHRFLLHQTPAVSRSAFPFFRFMGVSSVNDIWLQHSNFRP